MANEIDMWKDIEDAERIFGKNSNEYRNAVEEFRRKCPEMK